MSGSTARASPPFAQRLGCRGSHHTLLVFQGSNERLDEPAAASPTSPSAYAAENRVSTFSELNCERNESIYPAAGDTVPPPKGNE